MARKPAPRANQQRVRIAQEAARIIREQGVRDYLVAKKKAAQRLAIFDRNVLPSNTEIAEALAEQQRLFGFTAGETEVDATVFSLLGLREPPASPVDGRPMRRARLAEVEALLAEAV